MNPFAANTTSIRGSITPLVTPFHADGSLDLGAVGRLVDWQLEHGSHAISVGGSTGEPTSQTVAERIAVMRAAAEAIDARVPLLPGTGSAIMSETLELTSEAQSLGAAAALVVTPYYSRAQQDGLFNWYSRVANEFPDLPIIVYNVPIRAAVEIAPATVLEAREAMPSLRETNFKAFRVAGAQNPSFYLTWSIYRLGRHRIQHKTPPQYPVIYYVGRCRLIFK